VCTRFGFDRPLDEWVDSLVDLLREAGFPKAGRSEVVRVALGQLKETLNDRQSVQVVKFFLDQYSERRLARLKHPRSEEV
jgi:hypothetical protein